MLSNKTVFSFHNVSEKFNLGFNNLSLKKFQKHLRYIKQLNINNCELCFDDAYEDIYYNVNQLNLNFKKTLFPISKFIGKNNKWDVNFVINKKRHANLKQIKRMLDNGWSVGSHGHNHLSYYMLNNYQIYDDLKHSKDILEDLLDIKIDTFTPPFGYFKSSYLSLVKKAGYSDIYLNKCYLDESIVNSELNISVRIPIYLIDNLYSLQRKISNNIYQEKLDKMIHYCSKATVFIKKMY